MGKERLIQHYNIYRGHVFVKADRFQLRLYVRLMPNDDAHTEFALLTLFIKSSCCILGPEISLGPYVPRVFWGSPGAGKKESHGDC